MWSRFAGFTGRRAWARLIPLGLLLPSTSLAGANAAGRAFLTWDRAGTVSSLSWAPAIPFPLFLQIRDAPDVRALAARVVWYPRDSTRSCYDLVSGFGADPSTPPDSLYG